MGIFFLGVEVLEGCEDGRYVVIECDLSTYELMRERSERRREP